MNKPQSSHNVSTISADNISVNISSQKLLEKSNKPYKSEMNLLLSYDVDQELKKTEADLDQLSIKSNFTDKLDIDNGKKALYNTLNGSPLPNVPNPMSPLPSDREYMNLNTSIQNKKPISSFITSTTNTKSEISSKTFSKIRKFPPILPLKLYPYESKAAILSHSLNTTNAPNANTLNTTLRHNEKVLFFKSN